MTSLHEREQEIALILERAKNALEPEVRKKVLNSTHGAVKLDIMFSDGGLNRFIVTAETVIKR